MNWRTVERLLRGSPASLPPIRHCLLLGTLGAATQGAALGASSGEFWLVLFAAVKVPILLSLSTILCLPAFYVLITVLGLRDDLRAACRGLLAAQTMLGLALGALTPVTLFLMVTLLDPYAETLAAGLVFALATVAAQKVLTRHYRPLIARDRRHTVVLRSWLLLYVFLAIQLAWVLRPFFGTEGFAIEFFRATAFRQNAWVVLYEHLARLFR
ncbi:MAG: hypothetical protein IPK26_19540 [Planctomycetes bacterium]|nr:hypothetical protein [Planctomycetota bacterium]